MLITLARLIATAVGAAALTTIDAINPAAPRPTARRPALAGVPATGRRRDRRP